MGSFVMNAYNMLRHSSWLWLYRGHTSFKGLVTKSLLCQQQLLSNQRVSAKPDASDNLFSYFELCVHKNDGKDTTNICQEFLMTVGFRGTGQTQQRSSHLVLLHPSWWWSPDDKHGRHYLSRKRHFLWHLWDWRQEACDTTY